MKKHHNYTQNYTNGRYCRPLRSWTSAINCTWSHHKEAFNCRFDQVIIFIIHSDPFSYHVEGRPLPAIDGVFRTLTNCLTHWTVANPTCKFHSSSRQCPDLADRCKACLFFWYRANRLFTEAVHHPRPAIFQADLLVTWGSCNHRNPTDIPAWSLENKGWIGLYYRRTIM